MGDKLSGDQFFELCGRGVLRVIQTEAANQGVKWTPGTNIRRCTESNSVLIERNGNVWSLPADDRAYRVARWYERKFGVRIHELS